MTFKLDLGNQRRLTPSPVLGMCVRPMVPTEGAIFRDSALREQCVVEIIWIGYMTELRVGLHINF